MAKNTNFYGADSITVLEGLEAVRERPGMYIGSTSRRGLNHMIYEIVDNSVDEHMAGFCSEIWVTLEKDGSVTVRDNGRGILLECMKKVFRRSVWYCPPCTLAVNLITNHTKPAVVCTVSVLLL